MRSLPCEMRRSSAFTSSSRGPHRARPAQQLRQWYAHRVQAPERARELVDVERASLIESTRALV